MKRILLVGPVPPPFGGIASVMEDILHSELSTDYEIDVLSGPVPYPPWAQMILTRSLFRIWWLIAFLVRTIVRRYDVVHIQSSGSGFLGNAAYALLARFTPAKVLFHLHGTDWDYFYTNASRTRRRLIRWGLSLPHCIVVLYSLWAEKLRGIGLSQPITVVRNFVHDRPQPDREAVLRTREELGLGDADFVVLFVGSVGWRKGVFDILKAAPLVAAQDDSIRFVLAGGEEDPGEMNQILDIVRTENLERWVKVLAEIERSSVPALLGTADLFLLPSYIEGMPISIIEALRAGVPVISTPVGGIPEMIEDRISGILIKPGQPEEIAQGVLDLRRDDSLRARLGATGREVFVEKFEYSKGIHEIRALYQSLAS
ncbi:MAG: glycosyltransferase family 4 protein [Thermodesulfobacteriota bacterium]